MKRFLKKPSGIAFVTCIVLFSLLAIWVSSTPVPSCDEEISSWISGADSSLFKWLMEAVSFLGEIPAATIMVVALVLVLLIYRRRLEALFVAILPLIGAVLNSDFKVLVDRPRPGDDPLGGGMSFPSGHTIFAVMLFGFLVIIAPKIIKSRRVTDIVQVLSLIFILLMGVSRVYLQAHWFSDTVGSLLLGGIILAPAFAIYDNYRGRRENTEVAGAA